MTHLIGLSGSLRSSSYNTALLHAATRLVPEEAALEVATIRDIPLYDGDLEAKPRQLLGNPGGIPVGDLSGGQLGADGEDRCTSDARCRIRHSLFINQLPPSCKLN